MDILQKIEALSLLNFTGKGEAFVESKFLTPLLEYLGYESHNDYEVLRHGDDGSSFKLNYPPVERGAVKVKHYNPDYIPTIRKGMFWVVEAKSPKSVTYPFDYKYIVQGLQYCIHPEIQAKYLVLSNGVNTAIYDPQSAVFYEGNMYEPIFEFESSDVLKKWDDIYNLLGVEKLRTRIEDYLKAQYDKLCLSSLDEKYPNLVAQKITKDKISLKQKIGKNLNKLRVASMDESQRQWQHELEQEPLRYLEISMEYPLRIGKEPSQHYVERLLQEEDPINIYESIIKDYELFNYFKKEHCFVALCHLHNLIEDDQVKITIKSFVTENMSQVISALNKVESAFLRIVRKIIVIHAYPKLREEISKKLDSLPEIERFVNRPTAQQYTFANELGLHEQYFSILSKFSENQLNILSPKLLEYEKSIDEDFTEARKHIPRGEQEINGLEWYGSGDKIYTLKNIACNFGLITREERESD